MNQDRFETCYMLAVRNGFATELFFIMLLPAMVDLYFYSAHSALVIQCSEFVADCNFFSPHSSSDGVDHLIDFFFNRSFFFMLCSTFEPLSLFFSRLAVSSFLRPPVQHPDLSVFHGSQRNTIGIPSAKWKRGTTGIRTADPWHRETYFCFTWRISPPDHGAPPT